MPRRKGLEAQQFRVEPLSADRLTIVYPIVSAAYPAVGLQRWRQYALAVIESPQDRRGLLALRVHESYFCGLLIYRTDREPWRDPRLTVELFVAVDLVNARAAADVLLAAAEATAASLACAAVQFYSDQMPNLMPRMRRAGYRTAGALMVKQIGAPARLN